VRRIEAVTGLNALKWIAGNESLLDGLAAIVKSNRDQLENRVLQLVERNRELEKELSKLKGKIAGQSGQDLAANAEEVDGIKVLASLLEGADSGTLRETLDQLKNKLGSAAVVLASTEGEKVQIVAGVTKDQTSRLHAGKLVNFVAEQVGGRGGGRPDMAQAGGSDSSKIDIALAGVSDWVRQQLSK
jgi:alanyl-tRNA synthetase